MQNRKTYTHFPLITRHISPLLPAPSLGIEPKFQVPETCVLSIEL